MTYKLPDPIGYSEDGQPRYSASQVTQAHQAGLATARGSAINDPVTAEVVGTFVDSIAGPSRTAAAVAGRLLEETVELCLATGLTAGQAMAHVADALHNQALKASVTAGRTVFPSQMQADRSEVAEECADVSLMLKDLCYVAQVDLADEEARKHAKFVVNTFRVSDNGTLYAVKPHVVS